MVDTRVHDADEYYDRREKGADESFCSSCGSIIKKEAEICPRCGVRQKSAAPAFSFDTRPGCKNRVVAALLAILLGGFGLHKFYLGKTGLGIVYLLFCWTGIPSLIGFIEGILYLVTVNNDVEFTAKYAR
jgi:TM2 domain-containing membrane protein YozV